MDYSFRANVQIHNAEDLAHLLEFEESVKSITLKKGEVTRLGFDEDKPDIFNFSLRTRNPKEIRSLYKNFRDMLMTGNLAGYVAWHECRHDEKSEPCTWNEEYYHPPVGGDV